MELRLNYQFLRRGPDQWGYKVDCSDGKTFFVFYQLIGNGYCRELLMQDKSIVYDREIRIGFQEWNFSEFIKNGLSVPK